MTPETIDVGAQHHLITTSPGGRSFSLVPQTMGEAMEMARLIAGSDFAPKDYVGKPGNVLIAIQMGLDVGLKPMQALQNIAVINGRPSIWGDAALALVQNADVLERFVETFEGGEMRNADGSANLKFTAVTVLKRKGWPDEIRRTFSIEDAQKAGLWTKSGPWQTYPKRMLQMRARSFGLRDGAADILMGLSIVEEAIDLPSGGQLMVAGGATDATIAPGVVRLKELPEPMQEGIEKGFEWLSLSLGMRLAKLNEFLLRPDPENGVAATLEEKAQALIEWLRNEFALRKSGQPKVKGDGNAKVTKTEAPVAGGVVAVSAGADRAGAPAETQATSAPQAQVAPLVADDQKLGF